MPRTVHYYAQVYRLPQSLVDASQGTFGDSVKNVVVTRFSRVILVGFLRVKTVKGYQYVYWCQRVRSRKKSGGDGKVKCPDLLMGNCIVSGKYLPFYFYVEEVPLRKYADAAISYLFESEYSVNCDGEKLKITDIATVTINWNTNPKISLSSKDKRFDCRLQNGRQNWRSIRQQLQQYLNAIDNFAGLIQSKVDWAAFCLAEYETCTKEAQARRDKLKDYRKNPEKTWTELESRKDSHTGEWRRREVTYRWPKDFDITLDEAITTWDKRASEYWEEYHKVLNYLVIYAPRQRQEQFRRAVLSQTEKLAKDAQWVEQYEMQLESARHH